MKITHDNLIRGSIWELTEDLVFWNSKGCICHSIRAGNVVEISNSITYSGLTTLIIGGVAQPVVPKISGEAIPRGGNYRPLYRHNGTEYTDSNSAIFWSFYRGESDQNIEVFDPAIREVVASIPTNEFALISKVVDSRRAWSANLLSVREALSHSHLTFDEDGAPILLRDDHDVAIAILMGQPVLGKMGGMK